MKNEKTIDDLLFDPLKDFLIDNNLDLNELKEFIHVTGIPKTILNDSGSAYGFVLEAYAKLLLEKFRKTGFPLIPILLKQEHNSNPHIVEIISDEILGNIIFRYSPEQYGIRNITEIDALYEFQIDESLVPIILEVTSRGNTKERGKKIILKRNLIAPFYPEVELYSFKFIVNRYKKYNYNLNSSGLSRSINLPFRKDLEYLAVDLSKL